jgi:two-component system sensor histidine kinase DesK
MTDKGCAGTGTEAAADGAAVRRPGLVLSGLSGKYRWSPGSGSPMRWFFSGVWLVYLIGPVADLFGHHRAALWVAGGVVIAAVFCVLYVAVLCLWADHPVLARGGLAVIFALSVLACLVYGSNWIALWIYVSAATGFLVQERRFALQAIGAVVACYALLCLVTHTRMADFLSTLLPVALIGLAMFGFRMQLLLMRELGQARETVAKLATNEERLRLARDMHDLTGQSLSLITLKSELAGKMLSRLPPSAERDAALSEVGDVSRVSRQTLHDIREAVSGYRRPTLAIEIITARTALEAAGIRLDDDPALTVRSGSFVPETEAALAWCLREAVTNVIRHSGARTCRVRLTEHGGELSLEVSDDGQGMNRHGDSAGASVGAGSGASDSSGASDRGSGLRGMAERLSAIGGRLSFSIPVGSAASGATARGFRLEATVPHLPESVETPKPHQISHAAQ